MKSFKTPTDEKVEVTLNSIKRELERNYFFGKLENPLWISALESRGVFRDPPKAIQVEGGGVQWPYWAEFDYLVRMSPEASAEVARIAHDLPRTDNPRVYHQILQMAQAIKDVNVSVMLLDKLIEYADAPQHLIGTEFAPLLRQWASGNKIAVDSAVKLARHLVKFWPDPREKEKLAEQKSDRRSFLSRLQPSPRFETWDYVQILQEGIRPLGAIAPLETGKMLIDTITEMIHLKYQDNESNGINEKKREDLSVLWCRHVDHSSSPHIDPDEALVHSLTHIYENVLASYKEADVVQDIFDSLSKGEWMVFRRVGNYLASKQPVLASAWIRDAILEHQSYAEKEYSPEFAQMIRSITEQQMTSLFSVDELTPIFESILTGPSKQRYKDSAGKDYTEDLFHLRQQYFHKAQLWPFEGILFGKYRTYFEEITREGDKPTLENYGPYRSMGEAKFIESRSPVPKDELARKSDTDIMRLLNDWSDHHREIASWWIEFNHRGLAQAFQDAILDNPVRFATWREEWRNITRPVFLRAAIDAATKLVERKELANLKDWCVLANVIADKQSPIGVPRKDLSDESDVLPDWEWTRQGVTSFLEECFKRENAVSHLFRSEFANLLRKLTSSPDTTLDQNLEVFIGSHDPLGTAINTPRGQALERITDFVNWLEIKPEPNAFSQVPEVAEILESRFQGQPSLTEPEYAILGESFNRLFFWDNAWAKNHLSSVFVHDETLKLWSAAFGTYLRFSRAYGEAYPTLKGEYDLAMENMNLFRKGDHDQYSPAEAVGHHLFTFYACGQFGFKGDESPLEKFYGVSTVQERRGVIDFVGRSLSGTGEIDRNIIDRCTKFLEHRLSQAEESKDHDSAEEFTAFDSWLRAEALDADWRLTITKRVLRLKGTTRSDSIIVDSLEKLLPLNVPLVVECFALLVAKSITKSSFYVSKEEATAILQAGFASGDERIKLFARQAQDNLLRIGRFEFMGLGTES
jgi:hypothetical protein